MYESNHLKETLIKFGDIVVEKARKNLAQRNKNATGKLSKSITNKVEVGPNSIRIYFEMLYYGWFQDQGVRGTKSGRSLSNFKYTNKMPPSSAFDKWTIRKGIAPREKGKFTSRKGLNFAIAKSIFEKGIKPSLFFTTPFEKLYKTLEKDLINEFGIDVEEWLDRIIDENLNKK